MREGWSEGGMEGVREGRMVVGREDGTREEGGRKGGRGKWVGRR